MKATLQEKTKNLNADHLDFIHSTVLQAENKCNDDYADLSVGILGRLKAS